MSSTSMATHFGTLRLAFLLAATTSACKAPAQIDTPLLLQGPLEGIQAQLDGDMASWHTDVSVQLEAGGSLRGAYILAGEKRVLVDYSEFGVTVSGEVLFSTFSGWLDDGTSILISDPRYFVHRAESLDELSGAYVTSGSKRFEIHDIRTRVGADGFMEVYYVSSTDSDGNPFVLGNPEGSNPFCCQILISMTCRPATCMECPAVAPCDCLEGGGVCGTSQGFHCRGACGTAACPDPGVCRGNPFGPEGCACAS